MLVFRRSDLIIGQRVKRLEVIQIPARNLPIDRLILENFDKDISLINRIEAVPTILDVVCRATGLRFAAVARVTEDRWIACSVKDDVAFGLKPGDELQIDTTICHEIRQSHEAVIIDHVDEDEVYRNHSTPQMYNFQSYISMPIFLADKSFYGTLCAIDPLPARVNKPEIIGMFKLFAELISFHIDAARKLADSEANLIEEKQTSELREQFIAVLGHDLRSPLSAISAGTEILKSRNLDPQSSMVAGMMAASVTRMSELIDDVMDFARGRLGGGISLERKSEIPLDPVLRQVIQEMRSAWPDRAIDVEISPSGAIDHDPRRMAQLIANLLGNALKHGKPDAAVRVTARSSGDFYELAISNASEPIPSTILSRLFQPFFRANTDQVQQGLGLGLYIASEIAKAHDGKIEVVSDPRETRFTLMLPRVPTGV